MNKNFKINFIGIGAQKCATTWIAQCLSEHPKICLSQPKEINFFNKKHTYYLQKEWNYLKGINWYKNHFNHCSEKKIKGEFSVSYIFDEIAPYLIKENFPEVKIIACLRNPIERAFSQYFHDLAKCPQLQKKFSNFEEAINKESEFIERGFYYKQLQRYYTLFPKENILVLIYEDIEKDVLKFIQSIYEFLGVDKKFIPPSLNKKIIARKYYYFNFINKIINSIYRILENFPKLLKLIKKSKINYLARIIAALNIKPEKKRPKINLKTRKQLKAIFKEDIKNLESLLHRNLDFWQ